MVELELCILKFGSCNLGLRRANIPSTDAWAPRGNKIVLTNDCKYWLNSSCAIVQQIGEWPQE